VAPTDAFQLSVGLTETKTAPFCGVERVGAAGGLKVVVKDNVLEKALDPPAFVALTRQK
jgi:hypothetical protein